MPCPFKSLALHPESPLARLTIRPFCVSLCSSHMQARIAFLQGERKGQENLKNDLVRRIKMLEYALKQERYSMNVLYSTFSLYINHLSEYEGPNTTNSNMGLSFSKVTSSRLSLRTALAANLSMASPFSSLTAMSTGDKGGNCCASKP